MKLTEGTRSGRRTILGFDIGGTKTACVEGTLEGEMLQRIEMPTRAAEPFAATFPAIVEQAQALMDEARSAGRNIGAISVSVGGPLRIDEGFLLDPPHLPGWHQRALEGAADGSIFPGFRW